LSRRNGDRSTAMWAWCGDADLGGSRGDVLTTRRTFKLEFHRRKRVQESSMSSENEKAHALQ
jgi:hypothetical protein